MTSTFKNIGLNEQWIGSAVSILLHLAIFIPFSNQGLKIILSQSSPEALAVPMKVELRISEPVPTLKKVVKRIKKKKVRKITKRKIVKKTIKKEITQTVQTAASATKIAKPSPVYSPKPRYPRRALRKGLEGTVKVKMKISPTGIPELVTIVSSSGHSILDKEALRTLYSWRFPKSDTGKIIDQKLVFKRL